jgi:hypothetical protein
MGLFNKDDSVFISYTIDTDLLDLYGIKSHERIIDTLTMIFKDCNDNINVNLAFIKELMDEETISSNEALLLVHQVTKIHAELEHLRNTVNTYCEN